MEKPLKKWTFLELRDYWYGRLIMSLAGADKPTLVMWQAMEMAIRWSEEKNKEKKEEQHGL